MQFPAGHPTADCTVLQCQGLTFDTRNTFGNLWRPKQNGGKTLAFYRVNRVNMFTTVSKSTLALSLHHRGQCNVILSKGSFFLPFWVWTKNAYFWRIKFQKKFFSILTLNFVFQTIYGRNQSGCEKVKKKNGIFTLSTLGFLNPLHFCCFDENYHVF